MEYTVLIVWTVTNMSNSRSLHAVFVNEFSAFLLINYWLVVTEGQLAKFLELGFQAQDYFIRNLSRGVCELAGKGSLNESDIQDCCVWASVLALIWKLGLDGASALHKWSQWRPLVWHCDHLKSTVAVANMVEEVLKVSGLLLGQDKLRLIMNRRLATVASLLP